MIKLSYILILFLAIQLSQNAVMAKDLDGSFNIDITSEGARSFWQSKWEYVGRDSSKMVESCYWSVIKQEVESIKKTYLDDSFEIKMLKSLGYVGISKYAFSQCDYAIKNLGYPFPAESELNNIKKSVLYIAEMANQEFISKCVIAACEKFK